MEFAYPSSSPISKNTRCEALNSVHKRALATCRSATADTAWPDAVSKSVSSNDGDMHCMRIEWSGQLTREVGSGFEIVVQTIGKNKRALFDLDREHCLISLRYDNGRCSIY